MSTDIHKERFLCFDLEMTGLSPRTDSIIEIGAVPLVGTKMDGEIFFTSIQPYNNVNPDSKRIHGLDGDELYRAPTAEIAFPHFFKMMEGKILLGQSPENDLAFLQTAVKNIGANIPIDWAVDISKLFAFCFPDQNMFSLEAMGHRIGFHHGRTFHNALQDTMITAQVFGKIVPMLQQKGISTAEKLIAVGKVSVSRY